MKPREIFLNAVEQKAVPRPATGSATSIATVDLMEKVGIYFPEAHLDAGKMAELAAAGHEVLGFDNVMPHAGWLAPGTIGRFPWITAGRLVQSEDIELAGAFGGPLYVVVPPGTTLGSFDVEIEGAVEAPALVFGRGGHAVWNAALEDAPLVELQGDNVIITTRSGVVASTADPMAALQQLDAFIAAEADLVGVNDDPTGNGAWQWFGTMSVAPDGRIDAIWNDTRNDPTVTY